MEIDFGQKVVGPSFSRPKIDHDSGSAPVFTPRLQAAVESGNKMDADSKPSSTVSKSSHHAASSHSSLRTPRMPSTLDDFEIVSNIGTGSYGVCQKVRRKKDGKILVWKSMDYGCMTESEKQMLVSEVNLLRELKHRHIVRYYDRIIDRSNATIYIIMEYCEGGDLAALISQSKKTGTYMEEDFVWKMLIQMTSALKECHRRKNGKAVLHRDLKPANVFLDSSQDVKLGDFGLARVLHHETSFAKTYVGTPYYMSPELVNNMSYNEKSDIWSMGCMLYELCALHPPFTASNQSDLNRKIRMGDFPRIPKQYSDDLQSIIAKMLRVEVVRRPSIDSVLKDPIVVAREAKLERCQSGGAVSPDALTRWEEELKLREKQLELREKELESRERSLSLKEKIAEDKLKRAESRLLEVERKCRLERDLATPEEADLSVDGITSILTKGKDPDTPKKKVQFDIYGKENLRYRAKYRDYTSNYTTDYNDYDSIFSKEIAKRQELKDRLYTAKTRALELRVDVDRQPRPRSNLLLFR